MIKNRRFVKQAQKEHYQQSCRDAFDSYASLENSFEETTNDYGVKVIRVAGKNGPIVQVSFPQEENSGEKCTTTLYKGNIKDEKGDAFIRVLIEDFYEANDVWHEGFVMRDGIAKTINPANVSDEHMRLITQLKSDFKQYYAEQSKDSKIEL